VLLIALAVGGIVFGVYQLGRAVETESEDAALMGSGTTTGTTATTSRPATTTSADGGNDNRRIELIAGVLAIGAAILFAVAWLVGAAKQRRRREHWQLRR
jgi:hypothetical protein